MREFNSRWMPSLVDEWTANVNADPQLKAYRDWVETNAFGFGERCFLWMWKELVDRMPQEFTFCEVGVFRGQIVGLVRILADRTGRKVTRTGITPLDSSDGHWESDYAKDIQTLHVEHDIPRYDLTIHVGKSTDPDIIERVAGERFDIVYIDGGHDYNTVKSDLYNYPRLVKPGGYLVIDDCNNAVTMPEGYFRGIESVSRAVDEEMPPFAFNAKWTFELNLIHNRILRRF